MPTVPGDSATATGVGTSMNSPAAGDWARTGNRVMQSTEATLAQQVSGFHPIINDTSSCDSR